ncbi:MAG TPA: hypothetical protein PKX10_07140, partial [Propioniciclava tarda]|nr:hypothetical protein [Propioniciclava tarda]HQD60760.1 hypothetical protein [Propioniciclava tarda]
MGLKPLCGDEVDRLATVTFKEPTALRVEGAVLAELLFSDNNNSATQQPIARVGRGLAPRWVAPR